MNEDEIHELATSGTFNNSSIEGKIEETHISWIILADDYVFKIKKPLKLPFLDFTTLSLRKHFCHKEVELNSRFTDIYLDVVPIQKAPGKWYINSNNGKVVDYAVLMKKMAADKRMDSMLQKKQVNEQGIHSLAKVVLSFHKNATKIYIPFELSKAYNLFNNLEEISSFVHQRLSAEYANLIDESIKWSNSFLKQHKNRFQQRIDSGLKRDLHGDLHSGNIFLYNVPVLFDCIEFNDDFRQIDILYEIAFLCMDLESFHYGNLSKAFLATYSANFNCIEKKEDEAIFNYFKCLRANVRAKVNGIRADQTQDQEKMTYHTDETRKYIDLMKGYMDSGKNNSL